jgi:CHAT domain/TIR domain
MAKKLDEADRPKLMTYFSHSYQAQDARINLHFWRMLSRHGLYFAVDPKSEEDPAPPDVAPMDVTYLEWLMEQSACFVAVVPFRKERPARNCSPYQLFEYRLAVRAKKPRLIFFEKDLEASLFDQRDRPVPFSRDRSSMESYRERNEQFAREFALRVRGQVDPEPRGRRPIGLVADLSVEPYRKAWPGIKQFVEGSLQRSVTAIDPAVYQSDQLLLQQLRDCDVVIAEVRSPYLPPDVYGLIHGHFLPTLRVAYLGPGETRQDAALAMRLSADRISAAAEGQHGWPVVLGGYQLDERMEPVLFWEDLRFLEDQITARLRRIVDEQREFLNDEGKALHYFIRCGSPRSKVFISNDNGQNDLARHLFVALRSEAIDVYHYKDPERDPGRPNWKDEVRSQIDACTIFVALMGPGYQKSEWCRWETEVAVERFKAGALELITFQIGNEETPPELWAVDKHVQDLGPGNLKDRVGKVVRRVVESFERGRRVILTDQDRTLLVRSLEKQAELRTPDGLREELMGAGLSQEVVEAAAKAGGAAAAPDLWKVVRLLADWPQRIVPWRTALGLFLTHALRLAEPAARRAVGAVVRDQSLMPDVRLRLCPPSATRELGLVIDSGTTRGTVGTFERVRDGSLDGLEEVALSTGFAPMTDLINLVATRPDWKNWVALQGNQVVAGRVFEGFREKYLREVGPAAQGRGELGLCVASREAGLRLPIEWATFDVLPTPLALSHPVRRYLLGVSHIRTTVREMLQSGPSSPLRVLIFGPNKGDLPWVDEEVKAVHSIYKAWYEDLGWPETDLLAIGAQSATASQLEMALRRGVHVLHFAGHGDQTGDEAGLAVIDNDPGRYTTLPAAKLCDWASRSELRLVYLSSCHGAGVDEPPARATIRRFESLAPALVHAGVPEVVGFLWPILDSQGRDFAERFHEGYLGHLDPATKTYSGAFDVATAAFRARNKFSLDAQIWAATMVLSQRDSPLPTRQ